MGLEKLSFIRNILANRPLQHLPLEIMTFGLRQVGGNAATPGSNMTFWLGQYDIQSAAGFSEVSASAFTTRIVGQVGTLSAHDSV